MKVKNWFYYNKILQPEELFKGLSRIFISIVGKCRPQLLCKIRNRLKNLRCNFSIEKINWYGKEVFIYTASSIYNAIRRKEGFDTDEFNFLKRILKKGDVFIDVGANIGLYTIFAADIVGPGGKVLAFEPSQREFELLNKNIVYNNFANTKSYKVALSNFSGKSNFLISGGNATDVSTLSSVLHNRKVVLEKIEEVEVWTLDNVVRKENLSKIDVIKIDAEGHDLFVLEGAKGTLKNFKPIVLLEVSPQNLANAGCSMEKLYNILEASNYEMHYFGKNGKLLRGTLPDINDSKSSYFNVVCFHR